MLAPLDPTTTKNAPPMTVQIWTPALIPLHTWKAAMRTHAHAIGRKILSYS